MVIWNGQVARTSVLSGHIKTLRGPTYREGQRPLLGVRSLWGYLEGEVVKNRKARKVYEA